MKVFEFQCASGHRFEGWFESDADWRDQQRRGLLECPLCGDREVRRIPSAAHLAKSGSEADRSAHTESAPRPGDAAIAQWLHAVRQWVHQSEDVGERFPAEVRRMAKGEIDPRQIRGRASLEEAEALLDEGIPILPLPPGVDEPLH
ncbi:DUF1178 family protein [Tibeticola sp.]|uniref:DUF1178 family protein n=1 Tax=Tibeticola sp. TaxID=2005368 RepID=UPI0025834A9B|nr:DUF1178 family protein [Tibeticola sp.]MCI4441654.1 DUF1178 family protein [Tibeticola sp.]